MDGDGPSAAGPGAFCKALAPLPVLDWKSDARFAFFSAVAASLRPIGPYVFMFVAEHFRDHQKLDWIVEWFPLTRLLPTWYADWPGLFWLWSPWGCSWPFANADCTWWSRPSSPASCI